MKRNEKTVQIPESLFCQLIRYHLLEQWEESEGIRVGLQQKLEAINRRQLYTTFKTGSSVEERNTARNEYLEAVGIPSGFLY